MPLIDLVNGIGYRVDTADPTPTLGEGAIVVKESGGDLRCIYVVGTTLYCKRSTDGGLTWEAAETAVVELYSGSDGIDFDAAIDSNDDIQVIYTVRNGVSGSFRSMYQLVRDYTTGWAAKVDIIGNTDYKHYPRVAVDSVDDIHVLFHYASWGTPHARYIKCTAGVWGAVTTLSAGTSKAQQFGHSICVDSVDNIHVVYGAGNNIVYCLYNGAWQAEETIGTFSWGALTWTLLTEILVDSGDVVHIVWSSGGYGVNNTMSQIIYRNGNTGTWNPIVVLTDSTQPQGAPYGMSAAINGLDEIDVCFTGSTWSITDPTWTTGNHIQYSGGAWGAVGVLSDYNGGSVFGMLWAKRPVQMTLATGYVALMLGVIIIAPTVNTNPATGVT